MNEFNSELDATIERYRKNILKYGFSAAGMGWGLKDRQIDRFDRLVQPWIKYKPFTMLDVGCGLCDMYKFCKTLNLKAIKYTGIDVVPETCEYANNFFEKDTNITIINTDIENYISTLEKKIVEADYIFDFATFCGVFNKQYSHSDNFLYISKIIKLLMPHLNYGLSINFLSGTCDNKDESLFYMDYKQAIDIAIDNGNRFIIDKSYMQFEYTLHIFRDLVADERNVFRR